MEFTQIMGVLAGVIKVFGYIPYVWSTLHGTTQPNRASWWIWSLLGAVSLASWQQSGEESGLWVAIIMVAGPFFIGILSLFYGEGGASRLDRQVLVGSLLALALWAISGSPALGLFFNILVDAVAAIPTLSKSWKRPESESLTFWFISLLAFGLNLLAVEKWAPFNAAYPVYLFLLALSIVIAILIGKSKLAA